MIIVDVETTGVYPDRNSIVSIGAVDFFHPEETFYGECCIWDGAIVDLQALAVNGYSEEQVRDLNKQTEAELLANFSRWFHERSSRLIVGHNPLFDVGFIRAAAERASLPLSLPSRTIDIHSVCFAHMVQKGITPPVKDGKSLLDSDTVMTYVGIPTEPKPHIALNGALWEAEAISRLLYQKNLLLQFEQYPINL